MKLLAQYGPLIILCLAAGCAATAPTKRAETPVVTGDGLPVVVGFVHEETVHAMGASFSTGDLFWGHFFPVAGATFQEAKRFASRDLALASDVDLVAVGESLVYGAENKFKYTLSVRVMTPREKTITRAKIHQRPIAEGDADTAFGSMGALIRKDLLASEKLQAFVAEKEKR